jgi:hypothetical protein
MATSHSPDRETLEVDRAVSVFVYFDGDEFSCMMFSAPSLNRETQLPLVPGTV